MKSLNRLLSTIFITICTALLIGAAGCTEVDDRLGADMLPANQRMQTYVDTELGAWVDTYIYRNDSIPSSRLGYGYYGQLTDATFGVRKNSVLLQFVPTTAPYADREGYGFKPIVDSMCIMFALTDHRGNDAVTQTYEVYDIKEGPDGLLSRDKAYYANFPIGDYRNELLFTFDDARRTSSDMRAMLKPTDAGKKYLDSIVNLSWNYYTDDKLFPEKFQGLYITPAASSSPAAATYVANLANSGLALYARNHDPLDETAIYDTIVTMFMFRDSDEYISSNNATVVWDNVSVNMTTFDYSGTAFAAQINDTLPTSPVRDKVYVQSMGGVGTYLRFTDNLVANLKALKQVNGKNHDIQISQAVMYLTMQDGATARLDAAMSRMGSYHDVPSLLPILDYQYYFEYQKQQSEGNNYQLPYGGYLNRSNARYELDITAYMQQLAKDEGEVSYRLTPHVVLLGPHAYTTFGFGDSALRGTGDNQNPPTIRLTYTLIEKGGE